MADTIKISSDTYFELLRQLATVRVQQDRLRFEMIEQQAELLAIREQVIELGIG